MSLTLSQIAEIAGSSLPDSSLDPKLEISHAAALQTAGQGAVSFFAHARHRDDLRKTKAGVVLLRPSAVEDCPTLALACVDPYLSMARVLQALHPCEPVVHAIHPSAVIDSIATISEPVQIGPGCVVGAGSTIGTGSILGAHCVVEEDVVVGAGCCLHARVTLHAGTRLGDRCELWPGVVIGSDGFGYAQEKQHWIKLRHQGRVIIGCECEIGSNTTIDRGMLEDTLIGEGVKIDNQVQIAHNVTIGDHTAIAGCAGIAGSARIGRYCQIGGGAGVQGHVELADGVIITGMSKANQSISKAGVYTSGTAIQGNADWLRNAAQFRQLDRVVRALKESDA